MKKLVIISLLSTSSILAEIRYQSPTSRDVDGFERVDCVSQATRIRRTSRTVVEAYDTYKAGEKGEAVDTSSTFLGEGRVHGTVKTRHNEKTGRYEITVAYRGTKNLSDWMENLRALKESAQSIGLEGYVHGGFLAHYRQSESDMMRLVHAQKASLIAQGVSEDAIDVIVTGHSLGGAVSTIAAQVLHRKLALPTSLITYSSPRVFDPQAASDFERQIGSDNVLRVRVGLDAVPAVSLGTRLGLGYFTGFKHVGEQIILGSKSCWNLLENHGMRAIDYDASSDDEVEFSTSHTGVWDAIYSAGRTVKSVTLTAASKALSVVSGYFGRNNQETTQEGASENLQSKEKSWFQRASSWLTGR